MIKERNLGYMNVTAYAIAPTDGCGQCGWDIPQ
jgi:hypothetical protein